MSADISGAFEWPSRQVFFSFSTFGLKHAPLQCITHIDNVLMKFHAKFHVNFLGETSLSEFELFGSHQCNRDYYG